MPDDKRFNPEPDPELEGTRPIDQVDATRHIPPPPGTSHVQLPARPRESRRQDKRQRDSRSSPLPDSHKQEPLKRGEARDRSKSALYLPVWSVLLMLVTVFVVAFGIIALVIALGGGVQPAGSPRIIIVTAPDGNPTPALTLAPSATSALLSNPDSQGAFPAFALEGPTLPPVVLSPTPISITVGSTVIVNADDGLNIRSEAGLDQDILFNADNGARFTVTDGPIQANGLTWWQVRDPDDASRFGWAAADYLQIQAPQ